MFESNSNVNSHSPTHQTSPPNHFSNITDHYHHQNPSYAYLSFPSHLLDDDELFLGTVLPYSSPLTPIAPPVPPPPPPPLPAPTAANNHTSCDPGEQKGKEKGKRKRAVGRVAGSGGGGGGGGGGGECGGGSGGKTKRRRGKTDRHSKIHTAKGPRDRRMRLSLQIARKFFDLQDMLGFDKASKTIEWLFNKSKAAIKDLAERSCTSTAMTSSSPSSDPDINVRNQGDDDVSVKDKKKKGKKGALLFQAMRENREKARARARERTKEKLIMMQKQGNNQNPNAGSSSSTTTIRGDQVTEQFQYGLDHEDDDHQHHQLSLEDQMASVGIIEKYLTISSSTLFNFHHENHDYQHLTRVPRSSCDLMMASNEINFASFPANWVTQDMNMCSNHIQVQNPNCGLIGRPYSQGN